METTGSERLLNGLSTLYAKLCNATKWARRLYWETAATILSIPDHAEALAAWEAAISSRADTVNRFLEWAYSRIPGARVCVLGPLTNERPRGCDVTFSVQSKTLFGVDVIFTDLDSPWPPIEGSVAARWLLIHTHSDNWRNVLIIDFENIVYTSQAYCIPPVLGIGGFTDGDRPIVLAASLGAREILAIGYSKEPSCLHKTVCNPVEKTVKLNIAWRIIRNVRILGYIVEEVGETLRLKLR